MASRPRPLREIGRRGALLLVYGLVWVGIGVDILHGRDIPPDLWLAAAPAPIRPALWIATGWVAIGYALRPACVASDSPGWLALYIAPALRAAAWASSWVDSIGDTDGDPTAWVPAALYGAMVAAVIIRAGWREPERPQAG